MGVKEDLALYLEQYGDAKVIAIEQQPGKQIKIGGWTDAKEQMSGPVIACAPGQALDSSDTSISLYWRSCSCIL